MEKNIKTGVIISTIIIVVLSIILIGSLLKLVGLKQLGNKNPGDDKFISYGKTSKTDNKDKGNSVIDDNVINEVDTNKIDINAFVENILLRDGVVNTVATNVDGTITSNETSTTNQGQRQTVDVGSLGNELDPGDLMMLTDILNRADYNPFVVQTYSNVDNINVYNIFYNGAGDISSREQNLWDEYKEVIGREASEDIVKVRVSYIEELLNKRLGKVPDGWRSSFRGTYSDKYQAYYFEHSDTNYLTMKVLKGYYKDNTYTLVYQAVHDQNVNGTVTMVKQDNGEYRFVSNYINGR